VRCAVAQTALADVGRLDDEKRRHREIAEQHFAHGNGRMFRGDHLAKSPDRNVAKAIRGGKQRPVFQMIPEHGVGDVVSGEGKARDLHQQRFVGQRIGVGQPRFDRLAALQIVARHDEVGGLHGALPRLTAMLCYGFVISATATKFEKLF